MALYGLERLRSVSRNMTGFRFVDPARTLCPLIHVQGICTAMHPNCAHKKLFCMIGALMVSDSAALTVVPLHHRAMLESHVDHPTRVYFVGQQRSTWARRPRSDCSFCQSSAPAHAPENGSSFLCASNFEWCVLNFV